MAHEDLVADRDFWKKRALASEQERDELLSPERDATGLTYGDRRAWDDLCQRWKASAARVAELEAGINALADEWGRDDLQGVNGSLHGVAGILRALLEKRT